MPPVLKILWLIPVLPLLAAGISALLQQSQRRASATLAIGAIAISFVISGAAFFATLTAAPNHFRETINFRWFDFGDTAVRLGWVLDPLTSIMLVMVTLVSLLIFIYSLGYMAKDKNFTRFFCFLALFAAAMLGVVLANDLLLLFISWELVGLASYLLIGFWYQKPAAAAAAKKAFITTRIGDLGFFIGMIWLYSKTGTLLFYDHGNGCLEPTALAQLAGETVAGGLALSTVISILIFCGAIGKSGQLPLHVWLPDAMEGPTPVSALIHAATMVAAGVFLVARIFPLMNAGQIGAAPTVALQVITWIGALTAFFAATVAVAQNDIKRILAYSTVSQLGYMMMGLGVGGVAVGMFHLLTHAFFKALLFLGAGSVIHGCHNEQDIRRIGGLKKLMPLTFVTYAVGMMALCGVPLFFSGFWSKDEILQAAHGWPGSPLPFWLGLGGAFLTAFYMTRQVCYVFFGASPTSADVGTPHESPPVMTVPLAVLAAFAILIGFVGTPAWPWFDHFLEGTRPEWDFRKLLSAETINLMILSALVVGAGIGLSAMIYGKFVRQSIRDLDPLEKLQPKFFALAAHGFFIDELYRATAIRLHAAFAIFSDWLDRVVWGGVVKCFSWLTMNLGALSRQIDERGVNVAFDRSCESARETGRTVSRLQNGQVQYYLRAIGLAVAILLLALTWGCR